MTLAYPAVKDPSLVGTYPARSKAGGGFVWDEVLEYRVWCHPERGAPDEFEGQDYYHCFVDAEEALVFSQNTVGAEAPLALVLQKQYIDEPEAGFYRHVKKRRVTEWPLEFLSRPKRTKETIPNFLAPDAPVNRLEILRGINK